MSGTVLHACCMHSPVSQEQRSWHAPHISSEVLPSCWQHLLQALRRSSTWVYVGSSGVCCLHGCCRGSGCCGFPGSLLFMVALQLCSSSSRCLLVLVLLVLLLVLLQ
jgi:hypothetical protein